MKPSVGIVRQTGELPHSSVYHVTQENRERERLC